MEKSELDKNTLTFSSENNPNDIKIKEENGMLNLQNKNSKVILGPAGQPEPNSGDKDKTKENIVLYDNEGNQRFNRVFSYIYNNEGTIEKVIDLTDNVANFDKIVSAFSSASIQSFEHHNTEQQIVTIPNSFEGYIIVSGGYLNEWFTAAGGGTVVSITLNGNEVGRQLNSGGGDNNPFYVRTVKLKSGSYNIRVTGLATFTNHRSGYLWRDNVSPNAQWMVTVITFPMAITE